VRLRELLAECLETVPPLTSEHGVDAIGDGPANDVIPIDSGLTPAAVLVPVVLRREGLSVMLTQRTEHLDSHAGQISFPGGHVEAHDENYVETALRETEEETGLIREHIEVIGSLDECRTGTGYRIVPIVGLVQPDFDLAPDAYEVSEVFEVPFTFLLDPSNHQRQSRVFEGRRRHFYVIEYENRWIWGATASMLVNFHKKLDARDRLTQVLEGGY